jgi:hypothetical protein
MAVKKGFRRLRGIGLHERSIRVRNVHEEHMDLLPHAADHRDRLAEIDLRMSRRRRQRYEGLPGTHLCRADVILHHRIAAGKPVLGRKALENPLRRVTLFRWRRHIRRQNRINHRDQRPQLRLARRLRSHITRRRRKPAHLRNRVPAQTENTRRFTTALTLNKNELLDRGINLHGIHPQPTPPSSERISLTSGRLLLRHAAALRRRSTGRLSHRRTHPEPLTEADASAFRRAAASHAGWSLATRKGGNYGFDAILDIQRNGKTAASIERGSTDGYGHGSYSFTPDGETVISGGGSGVLTGYDRQGQKLPNGDFIGHEGDVWAVAPSPDGRTLLSGADDQTLRLWNLATRELLVTLFHGTDGEWVMWTPQGYYISSPDGDKYVGWQINRGPEKEANYVRASQLSGKLFRPDIIARTIELASAKAALSELNAPANVLDLLRVSRPPEFRILLPENGETLNDNPASVYVEAAPNPDPVDGYDITVNGRQVATRDVQFLGGSGERAEKRTLRVPLEEGDNAIRITARNRIGTAERALLLHFLGRGDLDKRGALYIVAVGVDDYTNSKANNLRFAGADARAFCEAMVRYAGPLHERCECLLLAKGGALFLAGHGANDGPNYVFLPQDTAADGKHFLPASVVRWHVFQDALQTARGQRLMFADTCHSGGAYNTRLVKEATTPRLSCSRPPTAQRWRRKWRRSGTARSLSP